MFVQSCHALVVMQQHRYGDAPEQRGELWLPAGQPGDGPPVTVLIHGGFWRAKYGLDLMHPLAEDLTARGCAVWNIEYRRVGSNEGDSDLTLDDVAAAVGALRDRATSVDLTRVAIVGHSAGGHLALWVGGRGTPGVARSLVIGQAAVSDLHRAAGDRLGDGATQDFLGGEPSTVPSRYERAQPNLDADFMHLVHGDRDETVPASYSVGALDAQGRVVPSSIVAGADHMAVIDPVSAAWAIQVGLLERALGFAR